MQILNINQIVFFITFFLHSECFICWFSCPEQLPLMDFFKHVKYCLFEQISPFFCPNNFDKAGTIWQIPTTMAPVKNLPSVSLWLPQKTSPSHRMHTPKFATSLTMLQVFCFLFCFVFCLFQFSSRVPANRKQEKGFVDLCASDI